MSLLRLENMTVRRAGRVVVDSVSLAVEPGEVMGLIGPNGAGKTTLLRAALGLLPHEGASSLAALPLRDRARAAAFLPQARDIAWAVPVADLVALGRAGGEDPAAVDRAIRRMDLDAFRDRPATGLSGGEQARVLIARALAQDTPLLIADEPAAGLDPAAQIRTMQVFRDLAAEGRGVIASIHDLGLAARFCDRLALMDQGRLVATGPARAVLESPDLARVFGIRIFIAETGDGPVFQPVGLRR